MNLTFFDEESPGDISGNDNRILPRRIDCDNRLFYIKITPMQAIYRQINYLTKIFTE